MRRKNELVIIHFQALELYPPAMNMIDFLNKQYGGSIKVYSFGTYKVDQEFSRENIDIRRFRSLEDSSKIFRVYSFLRFVFCVFAYLIKSRPRHVLYYESHSALPVYLYFKLIRKGTSRLFIHYHEYNSPEQYRSNMKFVRLSHRIEKSNLLKKAEWVSHTNQARIELFQKDNPFLSHLKVLPNYPPGDWKIRSKDPFQLNDPVQFVYVGSIGVANFYLKSFIDWLLLQGRKAELTIYTQNFTSEAKAYLDSINSESLRVVYGGVWYYDFPEVIRNYDVGLILYKGFSKNYVHNETNKLFEYLSLGLDVWFADETEAILKYQTRDSLPKVVPVKYEKLDENSLSRYISREGTEYRAIDYCFENAFLEFLGVLKNNENQV